MYGVYFLNVAAILRGGHEGHTIFRMWPALVQSTFLSLLRDTDHLTSADWKCGQTGKFFRTEVKYNMKHKNNTTKRITEERV